MRRVSRRLLFTLPALLLLVSSCSDSATGLREGTLAQEAAWPLGDKPEIGGIYSFVVLPGGDLVATDAASDQLVRLTPQGGLRQTIGRTGSGPLEFRHPNFISLTGDTLAVYDSRNRRVQLIGTDGSLLRIISLNPPVSIITGGMDAGPSGIFVPTGGRRERGLIVRYGMDGALAAEIGDLEGSPTMLVETDVVRSYALRGESPPVFSSRTWACPTPDGDVIAIYLTLPKVARFGPDGTVRWQRDLDLPDLQQVRDRSVQNYRDNPDYMGMPNQYWRGSCPDGRGGAYLVLNDPGRLTLYHLTADGEMDYRYLGPEGSYMQIAVTGGDLLWAYRSADSSMHRYRLVR